MPSISTCIISQLTALQRDYLICVNSIPQPCRTLQRSKCQYRGMRKIKEKAYVESNGEERQMEFTNAQKKKSLMSLSFQLLNADAPIHKRVLVDIFSCPLIGQDQRGTSCSFLFVRVLGIMFDSVREAFRSSACCKCIDLSL